jgi:hypothetical protein
MHPLAQIQLPALHCHHWVVVKPGVHPASESCCQGLQVVGMSYSSLQPLSWVGWSQPGLGSPPPPQQAMPAQGQGHQQREHRAGQGVLAAAAPLLAPIWAELPPWWPEGGGILVQTVAPGPDAFPLPAVGVFLEGTQL